MCCNSHSQAATANDDKSVHVDENLVATPLPDGYWLNAFPFSAQSELPDLVGYGLGFQGKPSSIKLFQNPKNVNSDGWKLTEIQSLDFPVAMTYADLTGDGFNDIIISDRYGPSMDNLWDAKTNNGGRIQWLRNPGDRSSQPYWEAQTIGNSTGMHRLAVGHFTIHDHLQVMGLPIIPASSDLTSPAPIVVYTPTYGLNGPESWAAHDAFDQFRLIHEVKVLPGAAGHGLDAVLVAGREGIVFLWFDKEQDKWAHTVIGTGLPPQEGNPYWGSGCVDVVRVGSDDVGYIATSEAFHGNVVSVYVKDKHAPKGAAALKHGKHWTRHVIDDFGPLDPKQHTGTIHNLSAIKVGHSNVYSFAVACMGAPVGKPENQGVFLYTPLNLERGHFTKTRITHESAGRIAVAGYSNHHHHDIASISYYVPGYHTGPDPSSVRINTVDIGNPGTTITAARLNKEVLIRVPRPSVVPKGHVPTLPMINLAGRKLTLAVLPPGAHTNLGHGSAVKVLYGQIEIEDEKQGKITRTIAAPAKQTETARVHSAHGRVTGGKGGAVFLHLADLHGESQGPFKTMGDVTTRNVFPKSPHVSADVRLMEFPFLKVETLDWASSGLWNDFEFYNMTGFYVYFNDDAMEEIVHIQAWTLGLGETARFHNHSDKSFCEIHFCLTNGGGQGGMRYFEDDYTDPIDTAAELTKEYVEKNSTLLVVPDMHEHGPLWKIAEGYQARPILRSNDTVDYPWHAWLASKFGQFELPIKPPLQASEQSYDVWMAFEYPSSAFQF